MIYAYYLLIPVIIIYALMLFHQKQPKQHQEPEPKQTQNKQSLQYEIEQLKKERESLLSFDSNTRLNNIQTIVLNEYEQQGIKIPIDIIDDIVYMNIDDKERLYLFIENQRKNWKNEHMKRFTRKEVK